MVVRVRATVEVMVTERVAAEVAEEEVVAED